MTKSEKQPEEYDYAKSARDLVDRFATLSDHLERLIELKNTNSALERDVLTKCVRANDEFQEMRCVYAPEGVTCKNCRYGPKDSPVGQYANGCIIYEFYRDLQLEMMEG